MLLAIDRREVKGHVLLVGAMDNAAAHAVTAGAWGLLLADVARQAANAYGNEGHNRAEVLARIRQLLDLELSNPTDTPTKS